MEGDNWNMQWSDNPESYAKAFDSRERCKGITENGGPCKSKSCYWSIYGWRTTIYCPEHLDQASLLSRLKFSSIFATYIVLIILVGTTDGKNGAEAIFGVFLSYLLFRLFHNAGLFYREPEEYKKQVLELYELRKQYVEEFRERQASAALEEARETEGYWRRVERREARNAELWEEREPKLRSIAKHVFSNIDKFGIDLSAETLSFSVGGRSLSYGDVLTKSNKSIEEEMKEDKNRRPTPRCSARGCSRPARSGYGGFCPSHYDTYHGGA